jgi:glutamate/tyrosine decarboxylase-like PLP-dependent enzyme
MENEKDREIEALRAELEALRKIVARHDTHTMPYYSSVNHGISPKAGTHALPAFGFPPSHCTEFIKQAHELDFKPRLNTSSYVNVVTEPEEREMAMLGLETNIADAAIYPASIRIHDYVVDGLCQLWNAPSPAETGEEGYSGAGTVGSTEACLLAGLAHKFRWRKWYAARHGITDEEIIGVKPNLIISTCFQACWEKVLYSVCPIALYTLPYTVLTCH